MLQRSQISFTLVDHEHLEAATVNSSGQLRIGLQDYRTLILPEAAELPGPAAAVVEQFSAAGGNVVQPTPDRPLGDPATIAQPSLRLEPPVSQIALGKFLRDDREIVVLVNVGGQHYHGHLVCPKHESWLQLDPSNGTISRATRDDRGHVSLSFAPRQTWILVHERQSP
jgi:hypothetical protein